MAFLNLPPVACHTSLQIQLPLRPPLRRALHPSAHPFPPRPTFFVFTSLPRERRMREGGGQKEGKKETLPLTSICVQVPPPSGVCQPKPHKRNGRHPERTPRSRGAGALRAARALTAWHPHTTLKWTRRPHARGTRGTDSGNAQVGHAPRGRAGLSPAPAPPARSPLSAAQRSPSVRPSVRPESRRPLRTQRNAALSPVPSFGPPAGRAQPPLPAPAFQPSAHRPPRAPQAPPPQARGARAACFQPAMADAAAPPGLPSV